MHRVGIVGAGQLARMMAQAAIPLGIDITLLAASEDDGAAKVVPKLVIGPPDDPERLRELASKVDVVTFDHELVDPDVLAAMVEEGHRILPDPNAMRLAQNKRLQREQLSAAGITGPVWARIGCVADVERFANEHGWPVVLKAVTGGYDGRGVWIGDDQASAAEVVRLAEARSTELLAEAFQPLTGELAVLVARTPQGESEVYPATETVQRDGICHELHIPARFGENVSRQAEKLALQIADIIGSVGILAVEFFVVGDSVLVNELAPRPHNSGHWTIEGAVTSQFEQHLRAVLGWPLGSTDMTGKAIVTRNLLGPANRADPFASIPVALSHKGAHLHWYGKESRPGRKIGHVTAVAETAQQAGSIALASWSELVCTNLGKA